MKQIVVLVSLLLGSVLQAQTTSPGFSLTGEVQLPVAVQDKAFKGIMQGLINGEPSLQFTLPNSLSFAIGGKYSYFTINEFRIDENIRGGMHTYGGFIKIGREKFHSDRFATDIGLKAGYVNNLFTTSFYTVDPSNVNNTVVTSRHREEHPSFYLQPTLGLILTADEQNAYRLSIGYNISMFSFSPYQLGLNSTKGYQGDEISKNTASFLIGFGYTRYFNSGR